MDTLRNADLYYGHSMKGKSRAIAELVEHIYGKTGKKSRVYIGDGGVSTYHSTGLVEAGILEVVEFSHLPAAMTYLKAMTRGWAPKEDGVWAQPSPDYMAGKTHGLVIYEGATVIKSWLLGDISEKIAKGQKIGGVKDEGGELVTVDEKVEGLPDEWRRHGQVQGLHRATAYRELERAIRTSTMGSTASSPARSSSVLMSVGKPEPPPSVRCLGTVSTSTRPCRRTERRMTSPDRTSIFWNPSIVSTPDHTLTRMGWR